LKAVEATVKGSNSVRMATDRKAPAEDTRPRASHHIAANAATTHN
jgi:hypothetical protein